MAHNVINPDSIAGLAKREFDRDSVKLHMTLINVANTSTDDDDNNGDDNGIKATNNNEHRKPCKKSFDARNILDKYADYEFGQQTLTEVHLAIMKSKEKNGFYKCTTSIQL